MHAYRTGKYLYQSGDSSVSSAFDTETPAVDNYDKCVWRVASIDYYGTSKPVNTSYANELRSGFTVNTMNIDLNTTVTPVINTNPSNALWASADEFTYSIESASHAGCVTCDNTAHKIRGNGAGTAVIRATHKVTGLSKTFEVTVNCPTVTIPCAYGTAPSYSNTVSFPVYISNHISGYSSLLSGVTWYACENDVIDFNSQDMTVTAKALGLAWLEAKKNGQTVLICYVYTENVLKDFEGSVRDYLFVNGTYLGTISCYEYERNHKIDPLVLRTEWYLYAVKLLKTGATDEQIRTELNSKFGLSLEDGDLFRLFISEVDQGSRGGYARDKIKLSFDGLRDLLNFFWLHYVNAMIATIDTVNVYTPATQQDVIEEIQYSKRLCSESRDLITQAQYAQTQGQFYADSFQPVLLKKGTKIYRLCVSSEQLCLGNWYMSEESFIASGRDYSSIYGGLQVPTEGFSGTRYKIAEYIIDQDVYVAGGIVKNNPKHGNGGYLQYFINNWEQIIDSPSNIYDLINLP